MAQKAQLSRGTEGCLRTLLSYAFVVPCGMRTKNAQVMPPRCALLWFWFDRPASEEGRRLSSASAHSILSPRPRTRYPMKTSLILLLATAWVGWASDVELRAALPAFCTDATTFAVADICEEVGLTTGPAGCPGSSPLKSWLSCG